MHMASVKIRSRNGGLKTRSTTFIARIFSAVVGISCSDFEDELTQSIANPNFAKLSLLLLHEVASITPVDNVIHRVWL